MVVYFFILTTKQGQLNWGFGVHYGFEVSSSHRSDDDADHNNGGDQDDSNDGDGDGLFQSPQPKVSARVGCIKNKNSAENTRQLALPYHNISLFTAQQIKWII